MPQYVVNKTVDIGISYNASKVLLLTSFISFWKPLNENS